MDPSSAVIEVDPNFNNEDMEKFDEFSSPQFSKRSPLGSNEPDFTIAKDNDHSVMANNRG